jgi:hypothetical protein
VNVYRYPSNLLLWFGVGGGGLAWIVEFVSGVFFTYARCYQPAPRQVALQAWQTGLAAGGAVIGVAGLLVCVWVYLRTHNVGDLAAEDRRGDGHPPPLGRIHFLVVCGMLVNLTALAIMVMVAVAAPQLAFCQQST